VLVICHPPHAPRLSLTWCVYTYSRSCVALSLPWFYAAVSRLVGVSRGHYMLCYILLSLLHWKSLLDRSIGVCRAVSNIPHSVYHFALFCGSLIRVRL
jgi:hypothetical protein